MEIPRLRSWGIRGGSAILDQAVFSGSNFVLNILLARWLSLEEFGVFSVTFTIFLVLTGFHNALLLEPMSVIGPAQHSDKLYQYMAGQIRLHFVLTLPIGLLVAITGWLLLTTQVGSAWLAKTLIGLGIAFPFLLLQWLVRRMFYIMERPSYAMFSSISYAILLLTGLWLADKNGILSASLAFGLMGGASLGSGLLMGLKMKEWLYSGSNLSLRIIYNANWEFGKWLVGAAILSGVVGRVQIFFVAGIINVEAAGALKVLQNYMLPMAQIVIAITSLALPNLAAEYGRGNIRTLQKKGLFIGLALTCAAIVYGLGLFVFAAPLEQLLYNGQFSSFNHLIPVVGLIPILSALATRFSLSLRAINKPKYFLIASAVNATVSFISAIFFTKLWGLSGAVLSLVLPFFTNVVISIVFYRLWFIHPASEKS